MPVIQPDRPLRTYPHADLEPKWQAAWEQACLFHSEPSAERPNWVVIELPPFANGTLHLGHVRNYAIGDACARFRRMAGFNVLYTSGFDSFGLPNELAAETSGRHPKELADEIIVEMKQQFVRLGLSHDTRRIIGNHDEGFYGWIQWVFLKLFALGLAYRLPAPVNWCPSCRITLADSLAVGGACWRCRGKVETRIVDHWLVKETSFAEDLLQSLERLERWPQKIKNIHIDWIGRQSGAVVRWRVCELPSAEVAVFIAHPELLPCARAVALAAEHPLLVELRTAGLLSPSLCTAIDRLAHDVARSLKPDGTGDDGLVDVVPIGLHVIHPLSHVALPLVVSAELDLREQEGASIVCPAHVRADARLAGVELDRSPILKSPSGASDPYEWNDAWVYTSETPYAGRTAGDGHRLVLEELQRSGGGSDVTRYRLRDWNIARQRYWGPPIPIVHCTQCGMVPVLESDLPVLLPLDVDLGGGGNPLENHPTFSRAPCPRCGAPARRDTDTLETYSSPWWYHWNCKGTRTLDPFLKEEARLYMPVDIMIGGEDQARTCFFHLRMMARALKAAGVVEDDEPVDTLLAIGMVKSGGRKMSKSEGNTVDPAALIQKYGCDALRFAILAAAAPENDFNWNEDLVHNAHGFLHKVWEFCLQTPQLHERPEQWDAFTNSSFSPNTKLARQVEAAIERVTHAMVLNQYHQVALNLKKLFERLCDTPPVPATRNARSGESSATDFLVAVNIFLRLLAPVCPHLAEELWSRLGGRQMIMQAPWPKAVAARSKRGSM